MKVCVLASGSKGNSTYIKIGNHNILIDIGITFKDLTSRLNEINIEPSDIDIVLITHAHSDHVKGLGTFYSKIHPTIYMTSKTYSEINDKVRGQIKEYTELPNIFNIDDTQISTIKLSHDVECHGYILEENNSSVVYATDTGYVNQKYYTILENKEMYIFESNHDPVMNMHSRKPKQLRDRVVSDYGHLSNHQSAEYLSKIIGNNTKYILLAHLSEDDNTDDLALKELNMELNKKNKCVDYIRTAHQRVISDLIEL